MKMLGGSSKQHGRGLDGTNGNRNDIVDIREDKRELSLQDMLRTSLRGGRSGKEAPSLPSLLLWDQHGLQLFEAITYSDEYYLTESEMAVLTEHGEAMAERIGPNTMMVELGSG